MRITNFIKNYPVLTFISTILLICSLILAVPQRIYAQTKSGANPNCECKTTDCPNNTRPNIACSPEHGYTGGGRCNCRIDEDEVFYSNCETSEVKKCVRIKGCTNCTPTDCNPNEPCVGDGICKGCTMYRVISGIGNCSPIVRDSDGIITSCGNCTIEESILNISII